MEVNKIKSYYKEHEVLFKKLSFFLKLIFSFVLIYVIFSKVSFKETLEYIRDLSGQIIIILVITTIVKFWLQMWNWELLLQIDPKVNSNKWSIFKTHTLGLLFKLVVPGGQGSFGKIIYLKQITKKSAFFIILLEKLIQTWIFLSAGLIAAAFYFKSYFYLFILLGILVFTAPLFLSKLIPSATSDYKWKRYNKRAVILMISQAVFLMITFYQYYMLLTIYTDISFLKVMTGISLVLAATLVPISYSGLGIRESVSVLVLRGYGVDPETAVATSLIIFIVNSVIPALPGLFFLFRKEKNR